MVSGYVQRRARGCTPAEKSGTLRASFAGGALAQKVTPRAVCPFLSQEKHTTRSVTNRLRSAMSLSSVPASVNPSSVRPLAQVAQRYPLPVLAHGYTPAPNLVRQAWPALGATYAAYFLYETIISYQRGPAPPAIYVDQLAADLQINPRRIRALTAQLVGRGLLVVGRALDGRNLYDFRPLYAHVEAWAQSTTDARETAPPSRPDDTKAALSVRANGRKPAAYEELNNFRLDSRPPTPCDGHENPDDADPARQAVAAAVAALGAELDDVAPRSSATRALRAFEISGLTAAVFMQLAHEAGHITQRRRHKAPPIARPMAYWFDVLRILLDDQAAQAAPPTSAPPPQRPRATTTLHSYEASPASVPVAASPAPAQTADAWGEIRAEIAQEVTRENYARWFLPTRQLDQAGDVLTVAITGAETPALHQQWLDRRLRGLIERCAARVRPGLQVRFVVEALAPPLDQVL